VVRICDSRKWILVTDDAGTAGLHPVDPTEERATFGWKAETALVDDLKPTVSYFRALSR
jgi:hypothetical protein